MGTKFVRALLKNNTALLQKLGLTVFEVSDGTKTYQVAVSYGAEDSFSIACSCGLGVSALCEHKRAVLDGRKERILSDNAPLLDEVVSAFNCSKFFGQMATLSVLEREVLEKERELADMKQRLHKDGSSFSSKLEEPIVSVSVMAKIRKHIQGVGKGKANRIRQGNPLLSAGIEETLVLPRKEKNDDREISDLEISLPSFATPSVEQ